MRKGGLIMNMRMAVVNDDDGTLEVYFVGLEHWDYFELILGFLQHENGCKVLSNEEIIYIKIAELEWQNINFELIQDDMLGNYILIRNLDDAEDLYQLALRVMNSIRARLKELEDE
jgi:hypothetical protein